MADKSRDIPCRRLLVMMPGLLGESVMATAMLHAIRQVHPEAHITALTKRRLRPVLYGLDSVDRVLSIRKRAKQEMKGNSKRGRASLVRLSRRLARGDFDTAVILPLSFKAAALPTLAGIKRRIGYESDGRAVLLTDRLVARHHKVDKSRNATIDGYLAFARYLGAHHPSPAMHQALHPEASDRLAKRLSEAGVDGDSQELLLVNPGAPTEARRWSPRRMAHLCEMLTERFGLLPVVTGTPAERSVVQELLERSTVPIVDLPELGRELHLLKAMVARSRMMVTNDTGPRFLAAAMGVPVLTLFGPTSPQGSGISVSHEEQVVSDEISIAAKSDPSFTGRASLDVLHADEVFEHASQLYETTRTLHVTGQGM
ncbi:MAG: glycosyltransferase family 9 protein [Planctomycetota bacterium]